MPQKRKPSRRNVLLGEYLSILKLAGRPQPDVQEAFKEASRVVGDVLQGRLDKAGLRAAALVHRRLLATAPELLTEAPIGLRVIRALRRSHSQTEGHLSAGAMGGRADAGFHGDQ